MSVRLENGTAWVWIADRDPGTNEDNISHCNFWHNDTAKTVFICTDIDSITGNQTWEKLAFVP